jgi:hypothetical protein
MGRGWEDRRCGRGMWMGYWVVRRRGMCMHMATNPTCSACNQVTADCVQDPEGFSQANVAISVSA